MALTTIPPSGLSTSDTFTFANVAVSGNVGIGTSSPRQSLDVAAGKINIGNTTIGHTGSGGDWGMAFDTYSGGYFERMRIDSAGNVGIGTSSPSWKLHIADSVAPVIQLEETSIGSTFIGQDSNNFFIRRGSVASSDALTITSAGRVGVGSSNPGARLEIAGNLGSIVGGGNSAVRMTNTDTGDWAAIGAGIVGVSNSGMDFSVDGTRRMVITSAGNVGIGTSSPGAKFQVQQDQAAYSYFDYINAINGGGVVFRQIVRNIANTGTTSIDLAKLIGGGFVINNNDTNAANFTALGVGGSERMRITSSGNVGIGTSSPGVSLDVLGGVRAKGGPPGPFNTNNTGYSFSSGGDTDGGMFSSADGQIEFYANSAECMRITNTGVGIGGSPRPGIKLDVASGGEAVIAVTDQDQADTYGTWGHNNGLTQHVSRNGSSFGQFIWYGFDGSTFPERMRIDSGGNVGIGINAPATKLDVNTITSAVAITVRATNDTGSTGEFGIAQFNAGVPALRGTGNGLDIGTNASARVSFFTSNAERMRIHSSGNTTFGTSADSNARVRIHKDSPTAYDNAHIEMVSNEGDVVLGFHAGGASAVVVDHVRGQAGVRVVSLLRTQHEPISASAFNVNSDYRIKENIQPMTGAIHRLNLLQPRRFSFVEGSMSYSGGQIVDGFFAHEVAAVVPEAVTGKKDEVNELGIPVYQSIDQSKLIPLLTAALQEAVAEIATLRSRLDAANI